MERNNNEIQTLDDGNMNVEKVNFLREDKIFRLYNGVNDTEGMLISWDELRCIFDLIQNLNLNKEINLEKKIVENISKDIFKNIVNYYRTVKSNDTNLIKELKKKLPAVSFSYNGERRKEIVKENILPFFCIDVDAVDVNKISKDDVNELYKSIVFDEKTILQRKNVLLAFISPSYKGIKLVIAIDDYDESGIENFLKELDKEIETLFQSIDGEPLFKVDLQARDLKRLCFIYPRNGENNSFLYYAMPSKSSDVIDEDYYVVELDVIKIKEYVNTEIGIDIADLESKEDVLDFDITKMFYSYLKVFSEKIAPKFNLSFKQGQRNAFITRFIYFLMNEDEFFKTEKNKNAVLNLLIAEFEEPDFSKKEIQATFKSCLKGTPLYNEIFDKVKHKLFPNLYKKTIELQLCASNGEVIKKEFTLQVSEKSEELKKLLKDAVAKFELFDFLLDEFKKNTDLELVIIKNSKTDIRFALKEKDKPFIYVQESASDIDYNSYIFNSFIEFINSMNIEQDLKYIYIDLLEKMFKRKNFLNYKYIKNASVFECKIEDLYSFYRNNKYYMFLNEDYAIEINIKEKTIKLKHSTEIKDVFIVEDADKIFIFNKMGIDKNKQNSVIEKLKGIDISNLNLNDVKNNNMLQFFYSAITGKQEYQLDGELKLITKLMGYLLVPDTFTENKVIVLKDILSDSERGNWGGTGKSTFINFLKYFSIPTQININSNDKFAFSSINANSTLLWQDETLELQNKKLLNSFWGNQNIIIERKFENARELSLKKYPKRIVLATNKEFIIDNDPSAKRRFCVVEFTQFWAKNKNLEFANDIFDFSNTENVLNNFKLVLYSIKNYLDNSVTMKDVFKHFSNQTKQIDSWTLFNNTIPDDYKNLFFKALRKYLLEQVFKKDFNINIYYNKNLTIPFKVKEFLDIFKKEISALVKEKYVDTISDGKLEDIMRNLKVSVVSRKLKELFNNFGAEYYNNFLYIEKTLDFFIKFYYNTLEKDEEHSLEFLDYVKSNSLILSQYLHTELIKQFLEEHYNNEDLLDSKVQIKFFNLFLEKVFVNKVFSDNRIKQNEFFDRFQKYYFATFFQQGLVEFAEYLLQKEQEKEKQKQQILEEDKFKDFTLEDLAKNSTELLKQKLQNKINKQSSSLNNTKNAEVETNSNNQSIDSIFGDDNDEVLIF